MLQNTFKFILLSISIGFAFAQQCFMDGECREGTFVYPTKVNDSNACLDECKAYVNPQPEGPLCNWWTYDITRTD